MAIARDFKWIGDKYSEFQRRYPDQYVAIKDGKVISHGKDIRRVYATARRKVGKSFVTEYILSGQPFILNVVLQRLSASV